MSNEKIRYRLRFTGQVQGVGFRYTAQHIAMKYRLTGYVRNEYDGSVLCEVQGAGADISEFIRVLRTGRYIVIDSIEQTELPTDPDERSFNIRH